MASLAENSAIVEICLDDECPRGYYLTTRGCEQCPAGKYLHVFSPTTIECDACPAGATCPGGDELITNAQWWRTEIESDQMWPCPMRQNCLGGTSTEASRCRDGSAGPLCGICSAGYFNDGDRCEVCGDSTSNTLFYGIASAVVISALAAYFTSMRTRRGGKGSLSRSRDAWAVLTRVIHVQRAKIAWQTIQITGAIAWTTEIEWPQPFKSVSQMVTALSELSLIPVECLNPNINYLDELLLATLVPIGLVSTVWLVASFVPSEHSPKKKATTVSLYVAFIVLPMASTKIFRSFLCTKFSEDDHYLAADLNISCDSELYEIMRAFASISIAIFPIGIPLAFWTILRINRKAISSRDVTKLCPPELRHISMLFEYYGTENMYWEVIESTRRLLLSSVVVFMGKSSAARTCWGALLSLFFAVWCGEAQPCTNSTTQAFAFMTQWHVVRLRVFRKP